MQTKPITYPLTLNSAELSYILSLISAKKIIGLNNEPFSPTDQETQITLWQHGRDQLIKNGWLIATDTSGHYNVNKTLLQIALTMTQPQHIFIIRVDGQAREAAQGVRYYFSATAIIELNEINGGYQFIMLDPATAVWPKRVGQQLHLPQNLAQPTAGFLTLSSELFAQIKAEKTIPHQIQNESDLRLAKQLIQTISDEPHSATLMHLAIDQNDHVSNRVFGLVWHSDHLWQVSQHGAQLTLHQTTADQFFQHLIPNGDTD